MPRSRASAGTRPAACWAAFRSAPDASSGIPSGFTERRTGEATAASSSASHRSAGVDAVIADPAASASRVTRDAGKRAVGSGGRAESRSAWSTRPASSAWPMSRSQPARNRDVRSSSDWRSCCRMALPSSSRGAAPITVVLRSRSAMPSRRATAASARSSQSARRTMGWSCSASAITPSPVTAGRPSARACARASSSARRTAGIPPAASCSATGRCSAGRLSNRASRCLVPGTRRWVRGLPSRRPGRASSRWARAAGWSRGTGRPGGVPASSTLPARRAAIGEPVRLRDPSSPARTRGPKSREPSRRGRSGRSTRPAARPGALPLAALPWCPSSEGPRRTGAARSG